VFQDTVDPVRVVIVGGSGLVGRALTRSLLDDGAEVVVLSRDPRKRRQVVDPRAAIGGWSVDDVGGMAASMDGADTVVCLAGARVAPWWWTGRRKRSITASRVDAIRTVVGGMERLSAERRPASLVVVSGIDAYPESGTAIEAAPWTEASPMGTAFLAGVSQAVEGAASRAEPLGARVVRLRQGHVLARDADLVRYLALPVRLLVGGRLGRGDQWVSWVHIDDAVALIRTAMTVAGGVLNVTSPGACRQIDFVRAMARVLHRPVWFPAPAWLIRLVLGEQSVLLLGSRRVAPARAEELGFAFRYRTIDQAFGQVLGPA
jgi:uncharacterized protein (TIGR01777 family)